MADPYSPLTTVLNPSKFGGLAGATTVELHEKPVGGLVQIAGWDGFDTLIEALLGLSTPWSFQTAQAAQGGMVFKIAPTRVMLQHDDAAALASLTATLAPEQAGVVDLANAKCRLHLSGASAEAVLHRVAALDFSPEAFPVGDFRQSGIHHVAVLFHRTGPQAFELYIPTTWAMSIFEYMRDAARSFGLAISSPE